MRLSGRVQLTLQHIIYDREEHAAKTWRYRDKSNKMLKSVMNFKGLVDAGVKFDHSGYGMFTTLFMALTTAVSLFFLISVRSYCYLSRVFQQWLFRGSLELI
jgi:hypothetical protein